MRDAQTNAPRCFKLHLGGFIVEGFAGIAISLLLW